MGFPDGSGVKNPPVKVGDTSPTLGLGRPPREGNSNPLQYSFLEIPWSEEPGTLQLMGSQRIIHDWMTNSNI